MAKVFFHRRNQGKRDWVNEIREFSRIPAVGEYVATDSQSASWFKVEIVVHTPFPCQCEAEVYAVAENHLEALASATGDTQ